MLDIERLVAAADQKQRFRLDPDDPLFIAATVIGTIYEDAQQKMEDTQKKTLAEIGKMVTGLADQIAAAGVMAENAATAKAEKIVTQATEWATRKITDAGETVSARILADRQQVQADAAVAAQRLRWATIVAVVCSVAALSAAVSTGVAMWVG